MRTNSSNAWKLRLGAHPEVGGSRFAVWAPDVQKVEVVLESGEAHLLDRSADGVHEGFVSGAGDGALYRYRPDGGPLLADPASRFQPQGVHGPSMVVDPTKYEWQDGEWRNIQLSEAIFYELHIGAFSPEGTFRGATERLEALAELGVTAIEVMPVADFPGSRNWGYDGVDLFAPARIYGTPDDLRRMVDRAHQLKLAMFLDVVYNHFGPDGNYSGSYSRYYMSPRHKSPWGAAVNLDGEQSRHVREFFIENALYWLRDFHFDGLRLDAIHALIDRSSRHFLAELSARVRESFPERGIILVAEDSRNLAHLVKTEEEGGWGFDAVWADDFHHQLRRMLAGDSEGYYRHFTGLAAHLADTIRQGWYHIKPPRGTDPQDVSIERFVLCIQNHDQVGNRAMGDRLNHGIPAADYRAASALLLCAPETPLLFMGQEWAAETPFLYFTDHNEELGRLVTEGRRKEFRAFSAFADERARERIPDPQAQETFVASKLDWSERERGIHAQTTRLYRALLSLRRSEPAMRTADRSRFAVESPGNHILVLRRNAEEGGSAILAVFKFKTGGNADLSAHPLAALGEGGAWVRILCTEDDEFGGCDSAPVVKCGGNPLRIEFKGPCAIIFRESKGSG